MSADQSGTIPVQKNLPFPGQVFCFLKAGFSQKFSQKSGKHPAKIDLSFGDPMVRFFGQKPSLWRG